MTQKERKLLFVDLSARLPYEVYAETINELGETNVNRISPDNIKFVSSGWFKECKPYLRPMSSMTEEEFEKLKEHSGLKYEQLDLASYQNGTYKCLDFYLSEVPSYVVILVFDWLNAHHFDYRSLIEKNLAIAVTEENNPYK